MFKGCMVAQNWRTEKTSVFKLLFIHKTHFVGTNFRAYEDMHFLSVYLQ